MDKSQFVLALIGSAAVGALVSSIITVLAQWRERVSRQKELVFTKSIDLAKQKTGFLIQYSKDTQNAASIHDYVAYAEQYYWLLARLQRDGCLPKGWRDEIAKRFPLGQAEARRY